MAPSYMSLRVQKCPYIVGYPYDDYSEDEDEADSGMNMAPRGWSMRKGHRRRLAREGDKESVRGRARYSQSVSNGSRKNLRYGDWEKRSKGKRNVHADQMLYLDDYDEDLEHTDDEPVPIPASHISYHELFRALLASAHEEQEDEDELQILDFAALSDVAWSNSWSSDTSFDAFSDDSASTAAEVAAPEVSSKCMKSSQPTQAATAKGEPSTKITRPRAWRWKLAEQRANRAAFEYFKSDAFQKRLQEKKMADEQKEKRRRQMERQLAEEASNMKASELQALSIAPRFDLPPLGAGAPCDMALHDLARSFAGAPPKSPGAHLRIIQKSSMEYMAVTAYFLKTLAAQIEVSIKALTRIDNGAVHSRMLSSGGETVMFHGCRSPENEENIIADGFKVSLCCSCGSGFGTWFAYNAIYSNGGYAFIDADGWRHMFICIVSYHYTVLDNCTMRVVGQNCAYPQWLIQYRM